MSAEDMRKVVGLADGCELMSALTRFPDNDVAAAVVNGSVRDDAVSCAKDVAAPRDDGRAGDIEALCEGFVCAGDEDAEGLGAVLRCTRAREAEWPFFPMRARSCTCARGCPERRRCSARR